MAITTRLLYVLTIGIAVFALPRVARADAAVEPVGYHQHDATYVRLQVGAGFTSLDASLPGRNHQISGTSVSPSVAVGLTLAPNLVLYGELFLEGLVRPTSSVNGQAAPLAGSANCYGGGVGAAYYLPEPNALFAATVAAAKLEVDGSGGGTISSTGWGPALEFLAGKEWWVSSDWGIGIAAQALFATMSSDVYTPAAGLPRWTVAAFNLMFSATFN